MINKFEITASIVLYKEDIKELKNTVNCFMGVPLSKKLFLIDNTKNRDFSKFFNNPNITYIANSKNLGFGSGHNSILDAIKNKSKYHLILNPDVSFQKCIIENLINQLNSDETLAMIAPKVLFPDKSHQYSCRRYPTITELIIRRFIFFKPFFKNIFNRGIYKDKNLNKPFYAEYLTGCFHLYKTEDFIKINGFDNRYFLYMEDVDICRKIDNLGKNKLYYPKEEIIHVLKQGSSKNIKLFFNHLSSAIKYFLKWGFR